VHIVGYSGNHIYVIWDPEINQIHEISDVSINKEFNPLPKEARNEDSTTSTTSSALKTLGDMSMEDNAEITSKDNLYQPAKKFIIMKLIDLSLLAPTSYHEAVNGHESSQWTKAMLEEIDTLKRKHC
jgi:hypothetical protein